jgi:hypothetical protein
MPSKGSSQMTMTNQRNLSDRRAQQPLSHVYVDVDSEHGTAERQEIGNICKFSFTCCLHQTFFVSYCC